MIGFDHLKFRRVATARTDVDVKEEDLPKIKSLPTHYTRQIHIIHTYSAAAGRRGKYSDDDDDDSRRGMRKKAQQQ